MLISLAPHLDRTLLPVIFYLLAQFLEIGETTSILSKLHERWDDLKLSLGITDFELTTEIITLYARSEGKTFLKILEIIAPNWQKLEESPFYCRLWKLLIRQHPGGCGICLITPSPLLDHISIDTNSIEFSSPIFWLIGTE